MSWLAGDNDGLCSGSLECDSLDIHGPGSGTGFLQDRLENAEILLSGAVLIALLLGFLWRAWRGWRAGGEQPAQSRSGTAWLWQHPLAVSC